MNPLLCQPVSFLSADQLKLQGLLFGNPKATTAYLFIHGLASDVFSQHETVVPLAGDNAQVLCFGNRGQTNITRFKRLDPSTEKGYSSEMIGAAHEVFSECVYDIQGAINFLEGRGATTIYLIGQSTGCHKAVYYLSQQPSASVKSAVLLCPLSDYADFKKNVDPSVQAKATVLAKKLAEEGRPHELLPLDVWPGMHDAQRFLSLYTPDSIEEMFTYSQPEKEPKILQSVKIPMQIILAEQDEYADRPATEIAKWFRNVVPEGQIKVEIIPGASHNLKGKGDEVRKIFAY